MVLVQFTVVVMRYIFGIGSIMMQESVIYMHSILFMIGAGYTLLYNGHVRVDIFYRDATVHAKAILDLIGVAIFLVPVCILIWWFSWGYVGASWAVFEGSKETSGIQAVYLLKSTILAFAVMMMLQGISLAAHSVLILMGVEDEAPAKQTPPLA
ncbi:MAG: TRAP transporter small permease subunit [Rhodospirillales bacterium]|nr:TRAP transporter small permease subunit [Rhodospirillales bacterium]